MVNGEKQTINSLMNIDNYFGESQKRMGPVVLFLIISAAPFLVYMGFISSIGGKMIVPLKFVIVFEILWTARMALKILGNENERLEKYRIAAGYDIPESEKERHDNGIYESANELVRIEHITEGGMLEYTSGVIAYVICGYTMTYIDDAAFTIDFQEFLKELRGYEYDMYFHEVVDEFQLGNNLEKMTVYKDKEMMQERMDFYLVQDKYCRDNSQLYRIVIVVKGSKYDWKELGKCLHKIVSSKIAKVFWDVHLADYDEVEDIMSRDVCANVNFTKMQVDKHRNAEYFKSKVLYYGDDIPDEYKPKRDEVNLDRRRVVMKGDCE